MRVTKAIREYVEQEIEKKYLEVINNVGKEYRDERDAVEEKVKEFMHEAEKKAYEYLASTGFEIEKGYRDDCIFTLYNRPYKKDVQNEINQKQRDLEISMKQKTKQVLFDLEMGDTAKAELKEILDKITVE